MQEITQVNFMDAVSGLSGLREQPAASAAMIQKSRLSRSEPSAEPSKKDCGPRPDEVVMAFFDSSEVADIAATLTRYQRSGTGWDEWRVKNWPEAFAERWQKALDMCRRNGYLAPHALNGSIRWYRLTGMGVRNDCVMCPTHYSECGGTSIRNASGQRIFSPCWTLRRLKDRC